eukprot:scaffold25743_cov123-Isochrysis_galbana.AAC.1
MAAGWVAEELSAARARLWPLLLRAFRHRDDQGGVVVAAGGGGRRVVVPAPGGVLLGDRGEDDAAFRRRVRYESSVPERNSILDAVHLEASGAGDLGVVVADADTSNVGLPVHSADDQAVEAEQLRVSARLKPHTDMALRVGVALGTHGRAGGRSLRRGRRGLWRRQGWRRRPTVGIGPGLAEEADEFIYVLPGVAEAFVGGRHRNADHVSAPVRRAARLIALPIANELRRVTLADVWVAIIGMVTREAPAPGAVVASAHDVHVIWSAARSVPARVVRRDGGSSKVGKDGQDAQEEGEGLGCHRRHSNVGASGRTGRNKFRSMWRRSAEKSHAK